MNKFNKEESEIQALRERLSRLSAAILCVKSSLDLNTVLYEIVKSTRDLVGARYGVITTIYEAGSRRTPSLPAGARTKSGPVDGVATRVTLP